MPSAREIMLLPFVLPRREGSLQVLVAKAPPRVELYTDTPQ